MESTNLINLQNNAKNNKKSQKIKKKNKIIKERESYFAFYDDLKHGNTNKVDW